MRDVDVAIVGGGLAGSAAAAMLGRAGIATALVDPHARYPSDFRCEKLDTSQLALLRQSGLAEGILPAGTLNDDITVARFGRRFDRRRMIQCGFHYDALVNAARAAVPASVAVIHGKALGLETSTERQTVTLAGGEVISARLVVLANGLNVALRQNLGLDRDVLSACHSISIGFDVAPVGRPGFDFRALTIFPRRTADRVAYLSLFPIGDTMRANLFVYRDMRDPWLRRMRHSPAAALEELLPEARRLIGTFRVTGDVAVRPVDLYATTGLARDGLVVVGDAFATSCPAAGTGTNKVLTDVVQLCAEHIPGWLATGGMNAAKIAPFYDDPVKRACDAHSLAKAFHLRAISTEVSPQWRVRRLARSTAQIGLAALRRLKQRLAVVQPLSSPHQ